MQIMIMKLIGLPQQIYSFSSILALIWQNIMCRKSLAVPFRSLDFFAGNSDYRSFPWRKSLYLLEGSFDYLVLQELD